MIDKYTGKEIVSPADRSAEDTARSKVVADKVTILRCVNGFVVEHESNPRSAELKRESLPTLESCVEVVRSLLSE